MLVPIHNSKLKNCSKIRLIAVFDDGSDLILPVKHLKINDKLATLSISFLQDSQYPGEVLIEIEPAIVV